MWLVVMGDDDDDSCGNGSGSSRVSITQTSINMYRLILLVKG